MALRGDGLLEHFQLLRYEHYLGHGPVRISEIGSPQANWQESSYQAGQEKEHDTCRGVLAEA